MEEGDGKTNHFEGRGGKVEGVYGKRYVPIKGVIMPLLTLGEGLEQGNWNIPKETNGKPLCILMFNVELSYFLINILAAQ